MTEFSTRERVLHLLAEASELEHNLLCSYLFALFSLKRRADEGLTAAEHAAIQRWRQQLLGICVEEMVHLVQVANMASALGVVPHFNRSNLPAAPGYHPSSIDIGLTPFGEETLKHFVFLERPDCVDCQDSVLFSGAWEPDPHGGERGAKLIPSAPEYATVGEFYGVLRNALEGFAASRPEPAFCADTFQLSGEMIDAPALVVIAGIDDVRLAIDRIVEQGEGAPRHHDDSHFARFTTMLRELLQLKQARHEFEPARAVGPNPVMRPPQARCRTHVTAPVAVGFLDAFNAVYWMMLRAMSALYTAAPGSPEAAKLVAHMLGCMHLLSDLADPLTEQAASSEHPGVMAGPSFTMFRYAEGATADHAVSQLRERCTEIATQIQALSLSDATRRRVGKRLTQMGNALAGSPGVTGA